MGWGLSNKPRSSLWGPLISQGMAYEVGELDLVQGRRQAEISYKKNYERDLISLIKER